MFANKRHCILALVSLLLTGCAHFGLHRVPPKNKPAQAVILGSNRAIKHLSETKKSVKKDSKKNRLLQLQDTLVQRGVRIIHQGEDYLLVIPSDKLFYDHTPRIQWKAYTLLDAVAEYLSCFPKVTVKVAGFTDNAQDVNRAKLLSRQQARHISDYLWLQHMDARMIYAKGYGIALPIASNKTPYGRATNRRIEVSFRRRSV